MRPFPARVLHLHTWVCSIRFVGQAGVSKVSLVRRFLIAAVLLYAGSAQAVDYAQCEAMQRAVTRIEGSKTDAMRSVMKPFFDKYMFIECGVMPEAGTPDFYSKMNAFEICIERLGEEISDYPDVIEAVNTTVGPYNERVEKVKNDYEKAGCY